jgi:hypothetical protein
MPVALIGVALGARMKLERTSQEDGKSNGLAHERAQRRLDEVFSASDCGHSSQLAEEACQTEVGIRTIHSEDAAEANQW